MYPAAEERGAESRLPVMPGRMEPEKKVYGVEEQSVQYEKLLGGFSVGLPKGIGLEYHDTAATHAVLLTGVNLDVSGYPDRWKIKLLGERGGGQWLFCLLRDLFQGIWL